MTNVRAHVAKVQSTDSTLVDQLIQLRTHYDTLVGFISNMSFIAESMSNDDTLYAMNTSQLFIFAIQLHEQAQDSLKIFEQSEAVS